MKGNALNLIKNYLLNRQQLVNINDCRSEIETIKIGVLQGTILVPFIYMMPLTYCQSTALFHMQMSQ